MDQELCFGFGTFTGTVKMRGKVVFLKKKIGFESLNLSGRIVLIFIG